MYHTQARGLDNASFSNLRILQFSDWKVLEVLDPLLLPCLISGSLLADPPVRAGNASFWLTFQVLTWELRSPSQTYQAFLCPFTRRGGAAHALGSSLGTTWSQSLLPLHWVAETRSPWGPWFPGFSLAQPLVERHSSLCTPTKV